MPTIALDEFLERLERSGLLSADDLEAILAEIGPVRDVVQVEPLGRKLVRRGLLTGWQLQMLLGGREAFFLGNYRLLDVLGRGGMGTVLKAEHVMMGRIVAIKVMARRLVDNPKHVARFQQEIQTAAALDSPHVVRVIDAESVGSTHFLVMEFVDGADLGSIAERRGRLGVGESCEYIRQAAVGLDAAHSAGLVHRDLKPANLILSWTAEDQPLVKILDMGLARFASGHEEDAGLTKTGQMMGTPDYMSPEQAWDTKAVDIRGDIYALGCTLFRFLIGVPPFQGDNPFQTLMIRTTIEAPSLRSLDPSLPEELEEIVARMLSRDPADRYQDPAEVIEVLTPLAETPVREQVEQAGAIEPATSQTIADAANEPTEIVGASLGQFLSDLRPQLAGAAAPSPVAEKRWSRLRQPVWLAGAAGGVLAVCLLAWSLAGDGGPVVNPGTGTNGSPATVPLKLVTHSERTIDEGVEFSLDVFDADHPLADGLADTANELRLKPGHPAGAHVDRRGRLRWTPTESQGPELYEIVVQFRDDSRTAFRNVGVVPLAVREVDRPPVLESPGRHTVAELTQLVIQLDARDPDRPANRIEYTLAADAPKGMVVGRQSGRLEWTPSEAQGPGEYTVRLRATAYESGVSDPVPLSDVTTLVVKVSEVDRPPRLRSFPHLTMRVGQLLKLRIRADDPDLPPGPIRFSLQGTIPAGATIDPVTGIFAWSPTTAQAPKTWRIRFRAASATNADLHDEGLMLLSVRPPRVTASGQPVPDAATRAKADADVRDIFQPLLTRAKTPVARAVLAGELLEQAGETVDMTRAYALYALAHQTAVKARYTPTALDIVWTWRRRFAIDVVALSLVSFESLNLKMLNAAEKAEISEQAIRALVPAVNSGRVAQGEQLLRHAAAAVKGDRAEVTLINSASELLKKVRVGNTAEPGKLLKLTPQGKLALSGLDKTLKRLRFTPLFLDRKALSFVGHAEHDLADRGRSLWTIRRGSVRLETQTQEAATGFWDRSRSLQNFTLRAKISGDTTVGVLLIGGPPSGGFDGYQLDLRPGRFCQLFHRGSRQVVAAPGQSPRRSTVGWDRLELVVSGRAVSVRLNGQRVVDATVKADLAGFLGLDANLIDSPQVARLRLRDVRVRPESLDR